MANYPKIMTTYEGLSLISETVAAGKALVFTKIMLGDGDIGDQDLRALTALLSPKMTLPVTGGTDLGNGQVQIRATVSNDSLAAGFFAKEVGVYAKSGKDGTEKLIAYTNGGNYVDYIPDKSTPIDSQTFKVDVVVGNASEVKIQVADETFLTKAELDAHNADPDAHAAAFDKHNKDENAHAEIREKVDQAIINVEEENGIITFTKNNQSSTKIKKIKRLAKVAIPKNSDLDSYIEEGKYFAALTDTASSILNKPDVSGPFYLDVIRGENTTQKYQIYFSMSFNIIYIRSNMDGTYWTEWERIAKYSDVTEVVPVGVIFPFSGNQIPAGFLPCNGAAINRNTYANLYSVIGTTYGNGDGSETFNLPNLSDNRFMEFSGTAGTAKNAGLPNISGSFNIRRAWNQYGDGDETKEGAFIFDGTNNAFNGTQTHTDDAQAVPYNTNIVGTTQVNFSASKSNSIYGAANTVQPKSLTVRAIIKY